MPITVKLFGDLRKKIGRETPKGGVPITLNLDSKGITAIRDILEKLAIQESEVSHIFVSGKYSGPGKKVKNGERVGLFPKNMGLLYKWYFNKEEDD